jgi:hypothetical protein
MALMIRQFMLISCFIRSQPPAGLEITPQRCLRQILLCCSMRTCINYQP